MSILHHDESNGSLEDQVTAIAKNELQHNMAMSVINISSNCWNRRSANRRSQVSARFAPWTCRGRKDLSNAFRTRHQHQRPGGPAVRINTISNNLANLSTTHNEAGETKPYQPRFVIFQADERWQSP